MQIALIDVEKYKVIKEIHVYDCMYGQLKMGVGTIFTISNFGRTGKSGSVLFSPSLLKYCKENYIKI